MSRAVSDRGINRRDILSIILSRVHRNKWATKGVTDSARSREKDNRYWSVLAAWGGGGERTGEVPTDNLLVDVCFFDNLDTVRSGIQTFGLVSEFLLVLNVGQVKKDVSGW